MHIRRATMLGLITLLLLGAAACGGGTSSGRPKPPGTDEPGHPGRATLVVVRGGGLAGFRDTVRVPPDGRAIVTRRTGSARTCKPDPAAVERLIRLDLAAVGPAPRPSTPVADAFSYTVTVGHESATAAEGEHGRRAEMVDAAAAVVASCLATQSGQSQSGSPL